MKMKQLHVLHVRNCRGVSNVSGGETYLMSIIPGLAARGCDSTLACVVNPSHGETPWLKEAKRVGLPLVTIPVRSLFSCDDVFTTVKLVRQFRADILHTHDHRSDLVGAIAGRITGRPVVATFMGWTNFPAGSARARLYPAVNRLAHKYCDAIISDSGTMAAQVKQGKGGPPVLVIHGGVDLTRFHTDVLPVLRRQWFDDPAVTIFGMAGRIHPVKGQLEFLQAAAAIMPRYPQCRFVIVGEAPPGYEQYKHTLLRFIEEHDMQDHVVLTRADKEQMPQVMASFDILVAPSFTESFSFTLIEGMAMGKAVVSTDVGGTHEMITHGETGILLQPGDVAGLTQALIELIANPERASALGRRARDHVRRELNVDVMAARTLNVYKEVISWHEQRRTGATGTNGLDERLRRALIVGVGKSS
jgi:glycosyltransferase involved in cell wall biosynthesis